MQAAELFATLCRKAQDGEYDDEFLTTLIEYRKLFPHTEHFELFFAQYALSHGCADLAREYAWQAHRKRKLDREIIKLLIKLHDKPEFSRERAFFSGLGKKLYGIPLNCQFPPNCAAECVSYLSQGLGIGNYAPFEPAAVDIGDGKLSLKSRVVAGDYLTALNDGNSYRYWVGVYAEQANLQAKGWLLEKLADDETFANYCGADMVFDIMRSKTVDQSLSMDEDNAVILPLAATKNRQYINFSAGNVNDQIIVGKWQYSFFRIDEKTFISSDDKFIVGAPIVLKHSPKRRKFALNILVDALSWGAEKRAGFADVPNLIKFFGEGGCVFNNHYAVGEFTYPSFAAIECGMYPHNSQIFYEYARTELDADYKTISEQMKNLGYYCVNVMGGGHGIYNGSTRGYDRLITAAYDLQMYAGVERVIRQLESFGECDQFLLLHVMDTHPWNMSEYQINTTAQTRLNLSDRLRDACRRTPSVYLPNAPAYQTDNRCGIRQVDRSLKTLFDYINEHYRPDEYVIMLYSDHGVPIYDEEPYLFSECQNNATLMLRGAGVPNCGFAEELVSSLDIYKIMAHLHGFQTPDYLDGNLPAVFGGIEREYVIGNSIYPGQTYKLAIRTQKYECELETKGAVEKDGTVDLTDADICIYTRDAAHKQINDKAVYQYFASIIENHTQTFNNRGLVWSD